MGCHATGLLTLYQRGELYGFTVWTMQTTTIYRLDLLRILLLSAVGAEFCVTDLPATVLTIFHYPKTFFLYRITYPESGYTDYTFLVCFSQEVMCHFQTKGTQKEAAYFANYPCYRAELEPEQHQPV